MAQSLSRTFFGVRRRAGVDIYTIKRWMGHSALVTTARYMHVTAEHLAKVRSPLDTLYERD
jgi:site-specific recombinase XerD